MKFRVFILLISRSITRTPLLFTSFFLVTLAVFVTQFASHSQAEATLGLNRVSNELQNVKANSLSAIGSPFLNDRKRSTDFRRASTTGGDFVPLPADPISWWRSNGNSIDSFGTEEPIPQLQGNAALEELKRRGVYESLANSVKAAQYSVRQNTITGQYVAANPRQGLNTIFGPEAIEIASGDAIQWKLDLRLTGIGYGDRILPVGAAEIKTEGTRIELRRTFGNGRGELTEWYVNRSSGLEQGFTIDSRPGESPAKAPLLITMSLSDGWTAEAAEDGLSARLINYKAETTLNYDKLIVTDAKGRRVPAKIVAENVTLNLSIDDFGVEYPLTVDPTLTQQAYIKSSNTNAGDNFGWSVAISGDTVVVGAWAEDSSATGVNGNQADNSATNSGAAYVFVRSGEAWTQQAYLKASNTGASDRFGHTVSVSGDTLVVGAYLEDSSATGVNGNQADNSGTNAGAAYVFVRSGSVWTQQAYLKASNTGAVDIFGHSVAISGDSIAVGAPYEDSSSTGVNGNQGDNSVSGAGAVYVFTRTGGVWTQQAYLKASNTDVDDNFGRVVSGSDDTLVVGAFLEDSSAIGVNGNQANNSAADAGAAYVFFRSAGVWTQQAYLKASNTGGGDWFGYSVAVSGDTVLVGAHQEDSSATGVNGNQSDNSATDAGAAYVFVRSGNAWTQQAYVKASNTGAGDWFGYSLSVSGDTVVIGALGEDSSSTGVNGNQTDNSTTDAGAVYVLVRSGGVWTQQAYVKASNTGAGDWFGSSTAVSGDTAVVGAYVEDSSATGVNGNQTDNSAVDAGAVFVFLAPFSAPPPAIASVDPTMPIANESNYDLLVNGQNFQRDLTVTLTDPAMNNSVLSGESIQYISDTSFMLRAPLRSAGPWSIKVRNPNQVESNSFGFTVLPATNNPIVVSINPAKPPINPANQELTVNGAGFQSGLKVFISDPNNNIGIIYGDAHIRNVNPSSFAMRVTLNGGGIWKIRVANPDNSQSNRFEFAVPYPVPPEGLPESVSSPVVGRLQSLCVPIPSDVWWFCQDKRGTKGPGSPKGFSNDTFAWDINRYSLTNSEEDAGESVYAAAPGEVTTYVGNQAIFDNGDILIAHPSVANPVWFSAYHNLQNVKVSIGQIVNNTTLLGDLGHTVEGNHYALRFVAYYGQNIRGGLQSFNVAINERGVGVANLPDITSVPSNILSDCPNEQVIEISGNNFQQGLVVQFESPSRMKYSISPEPKGAPMKDGLVETVSTTLIRVRNTFCQPGQWLVKITNPDGGRSATRSFEISAPSTAKPPLIFIPGVAGSQLSLHGSVLWLATAPFNPVDLMTLDPLEQQHDVVTTGALWEKPITGESIYRNVIESLILGGYNPGTCTQTGMSGNLFVFPYDWRRGNSVSAEKLKELIDCVYSNTSEKVDILAHSMGGLVARKYIIANPNDRKVRRLTTLGTPWLGAPKMSYVIETGDFAGIFQPAVASFSKLRRLSWFFPGIHELAPSEAYFKLGGRPFREDGWNINGRDANDDTYQYQQYLEFLDSRYPIDPESRRGESNIGTTNRNFHNVAGQDNWRCDTSPDTWPCATPVDLSFGVQYFHFVGVNDTDDTIHQVVAGKGLFCSPLGFCVPGAINEIKTRPGRGDGTVPYTSAARIDVGMNLNSPVNYLVLPVKRALTRDESVEHGKLPNNNAIVRAFLTCSSTTNSFNSARDCYRDRFPNTIDDLNASKYQGTDPSDPVFYLNVTGTNDSVISDSFQNTAYPFDDVAGEQVPDVSLSKTGESSFSAAFPTDKFFKILFKSSASPLILEATKGTSDLTTDAVRYRDIVVPPNVWVKLELSSGGISQLRYDADGDGNFETAVEPTISVNGSSANDFEPPEIIVNETVSQSGSHIQIEANDAGAGLRRVMYSLDGSTFQPYSSALDLDATIVPTIYVFADDNVANRSPLVEHDLTASNAGFSVSGPGIASAGSSVAVTFTAPAGRPGSDWIGMFASGTLNSAYIARVYTNGSENGEVNFSAPDQPGIYEFRYLKDGGYTSVAASNPLIVTPQSPRRAPFDFDGDNKSDLSIYRPSLGQWWLGRSTAGLIVHTFGNSADIITPGDFTGDGSTDVAIFRPANGEWFVLRSEDFSFYSFPFGANGDVPVPGDYDGDGRTDAAVFRPSNATWYIQRSSGGTTIQTFGASTDRPVPADYDGDGKTDIAIYRPSLGQWWLNRSTAGVIVHTFGNSADRNVPGDYTGDGKADIAIFRPSNGEWFILRSEDASFYSFPFGTSTDLPVPGDYDGDGKFDAGVFRPSNSTWYLNRSTAGVLIQGFGLGTDSPVPNAYVR